MNHDESYNDDESVDAKSMSSENAVREPAAVHSSKKDKKKGISFYSNVPAAPVLLPTPQHQHHERDSTSVTSLRGVTFGSTDRLPSNRNYTSTSVSSAGGASISINTAASSQQPHLQRSVSELPIGSRLSLSAYDATLPMAYDNERFFDANEGYHGLLQQAYVSMADLASTGTAWVEANSECGSLLGLIWRWILLRFMVRSTRDNVNRLLLTRGIQDYLAYTTTYESFVLGGVIRELDSDGANEDTSFYLRLALWNRNACRILVQTMRQGRWDWFFHLYTHLAYHRLFDTLSVFPGLGWMGHHGTENYPGHGNFGMLGLMQYIRDCLFWFWRLFFNRKRYADGNDPNYAASNLASDWHSRASYNRDYYGTYFGREYTTKYRLEHRLTIDESIIRTFMSSPEATIINNGIVHVLRCLAKHWANMLYQENGNFAHQRMEQLNPFEILRFYMPIVLSAMANLRGRNKWDAQVLAPFIKKLQHVNPSRLHMKGRDEHRDSEQGITGNMEIVGPCQAGIALIQELRSTIARNVCAGIPTRMEPFDSWLLSIMDAFLVLQHEAEALSDFISTVDSGISLGSQLLKLVQWNVPTEGRMKEAVKAYILNKESVHAVDVDRNAIISALEKLSPKDERTLKELVVKGLHRLSAARLLLNRTATLLEREIRRRALDDRIRGLAMGQLIDTDSLERSKWYWVDLGRGFPVVAMLSKRSHDFQRLTFLEVETNYSTMLDSQGVQCFEYIPIAEAISRAQKAFMTTEVEHCKRFSYYCFMEFGSPVSSSSLRTRLRRLATLSQVQCSELDKARLNALTEIKNSIAKSRKTKRGTSRFISVCRPQNTMVVGGGPTGLLAAIHCLHNIVLSGGTLKVYEGRDAFDQEASSFERAQIVRLDSRQISMLRYHLGTGFEDVFIPAKGETDAHLGNVLPSQGFVEVTIKRLESMLLDEVVNLRSKDLLFYYSESKIRHNTSAGTFEKTGRYLKIGDVVRDIPDNRQLKVAGFTYETRLTPEDMVEGMYYDVVSTRTKTVRRYRLDAIDRSYDWYTFKADENGKELCGSFDQLPPIYQEGKGRLEPSQIDVEVNGSSRELLPFDHVADKNFEMDVTNSHVVVAIGKPSRSPIHFTVTTSEPYAICCIEGLKVSMGMHNFGEKRWGSGLIDDIRSQSNPNTRIVGDFTKSITVGHIVQTMKRKISTDASWKSHLNKLPEISSAAVGELADKIMSIDSVTFRRQLVQTRFFELGNNYYLGMEICREFDMWKCATVNQILASLTDAVSETSRQNLRVAVSNLIVRLWYEATLAVMGSAVVYNVGSRNMVPQLHTIESAVEKRLHKLQQHEAFRLAGFKATVLEHKSDNVSLIQRTEGLRPQTCSFSSQVYVLEHTSCTKKTLRELSVGDVFEVIDTFEVVSARHMTSMVRTSRGFVFEVPNNLFVLRASDLARAPDGYSESKIALATFDVAHEVCHRTLMINRPASRDGEDGYITSFVGDYQASPHFMRYSGLTGACINCVSIGNLVGQAIRGVPFVDRVQRFSFETNWSNGEVVQRGTGSNYGEDAFLRPGFRLRPLVDFLCGRVSEHQDIGADTDAILSRDWKIKLAAAVIPRGLERNELFLESILAEFAVTLRDKCEDEVSRTIGTHDLAGDVDSAISLTMRSVVARMSRRDSRRDMVNLDELSLPESIAGAISRTGRLISSSAQALVDIVDCAVILRSADSRVSSELFHQPKPTDSIINSCGLPGEILSNALLRTACLAAATSAFLLVDNRIAMVAAMMINLWNVRLSFLTMASAARYRNVTQETRRHIADCKMNGILKAVFSLVPSNQRASFSAEENPYANDVTQLSSKFVADARYYNADGEAIEYFQNELTDLADSNYDAVASTAFRNKLLQELIPRTFMGNSYLQEDLVAIYKVTEELIMLESTPGSPYAADVFRKLMIAKDVFTKSVQRGDVLYGFVKNLPWYQNALPTTVCFLLQPLLGNNHVANRTRSLLRETSKLRESLPDAPALNRAIRDLTELDNAIAESDFGSLVYVTAVFFLLFSALSCCITLVDLVSLSDERQADVALWLCIGCFPGLLISTGRYIRTFLHLSALGMEIDAAETKSLLRHVRRTVRAQEFLAALRVLMIVLVSVVLPLAIAEMQFGPLFTAREDTFIIVAVGILAVWELSNVLSWGIVSIFWYNLDPTLGDAIFTSFASRIETLRKGFLSQQGPNVDTAHTTEAFEYAAREFLHHVRFDALFGPDLLGSILQRQQSVNNEDGKK